MPTMTPARMTAETASRGACVDADPDLLFPLKDSELPGQPNEAERRALAVCAGCRVLTECAREVLAGPAPMEFGVAGGMTAADRRAVLANRRAAGGANQKGDAAGPGSGQSATPGPARGVGDVDAVIEEVLAVHADRGHGADPATVRALALAHPPATASRWEAALAAVVMIARGTPVAATARLLGEEYTTVARWRDRHAIGEGLVLGGLGGGTRQLARVPRDVVAAEDVEQQDAA